MPAPLRALRFAPLALVVLVAGCGGSRGVADGNPYDLTGTWEGEGRQWNAGDRTQDPDDEWPLRVTVAGAASSLSGAIEYPSLQCGGTLEYVGPNRDPGAQPGDAVFRERVTFGTANCADGGTVLLRRSGRDLIYAWAIDGSTTTAAARLERAD